ncbi:Uncharacterised protein [Legionella quinlivanii]|nr:Uncharacterised protein [Legionella quinlivanii]
MSKMEQIRQANIDAGLTNNDTDDEFDEFSEDRNSLQPR